MTGLVTPGPRPIRSVAAAAKRELDPEVGVEVLAVGDQHAVEAPGLGVERGLADAAGDCETVKMDLDRPMMPDRWVRRSAAMGRFGPCRDRKS